METSTASIPAVTVSSIGRTVRDYIFWNYQRGSIHYDIMVTLILLFIFVTPLFINFNDKPIEHGSHPTAIVVIPDGQNGSMYQVPASAVSANSDAAIRRELRRIIAPVAGNVRVSKYEKALDTAGQPVYQVWVKK